MGHRKPLPHARRIPRVLLEEGEALLRPRAKPGEAAGRTPADFPLGQGSAVHREPKLVLRDLLLTAAASSGIGRGSGRMDLFVS